MWYDGGMSDEAPTWARLLLALNLAVLVAVAAIYMEGQRICTPRYDPSGADPLGILSPADRR